MFTPHTAAEREEMLRAVGVHSVDELFHTLSRRNSAFQNLNLPESRTELEITNELSSEISPIGLCQ